MIVALIAAAAAAAALAVVCVSLLLFVRADRRRLERERGQLWRQFELMVDRNMHLTDGGAYSTRKSLRPTVGDDDLVKSWLEQGIVADPENGVPDYDAEASL